MIGQGQEHGRPKLSQVPYTGAEAVKKIFEQFSQMTASLNRFSIQLESIQDSAKHIAVEFHALAFQMRASRSLFSNDNQGGGQRGGLASHFARSGGGSGEKSDAEILASFAMRENAKILIRKQLAAKNNVKDPTLNDDEILADYVKMLKRKSEASTKFYEEEKAKREAVDSKGMTQDQRDHIEYLKKKAQWTKAFNEDPKVSGPKDAESERKHLEYLKKKAQWTKTYNESKPVVAERNANEAKRNQENLNKYKAFLEKKSELYESFQEAKRIESEKKKEEKDVQRKQDFPMPGNVDEYRRKNNVNTYRKEQTESAGALNNYVEYLVAKEIEYRAHQARLEALRDASSKNHKGDDKPLEALNTRKYKSELDQPESLAEDVNKFAEHYQKPLRSYYNYLTEKENIFAIHKKNMENIKNADLSPRQKRQKEKDDAAEKEYKEKIKGLSKEEIAKVEPPEDNNYYLKSLKDYESFLIDKLNLKKWYYNALLNIDQTNEKERHWLYNEKAVLTKQIKANREARKNDDPEPYPNADEQMDAFYRRKNSRIDFDSNVPASNKNTEAISLEIVKQIANLGEKAQLMGDIETLGNQSAPNIDNEDYHKLAQVAQVALSLKEKDKDTGKLIDVIPPLNIMVEVGEEQTYSDKEKFKDFNAKHIEASQKPLVEGDTLKEVKSKLKELAKNGIVGMVSQDDAAELMEDWNKRARKKRPDAIVGTKGSFEEKIGASSDTDPLKKAINDILGKGTDSQRLDVEDRLSVLIKEQKKLNGTSKLQEALSQKALKLSKDNIAKYGAGSDKRKEAEKEHENLEKSINSEGGKTNFNIEVYKEYLKSNSTLTGFEDKGTAHDASDDTEVQQHMTAIFIKIAEDLVNGLKEKSEDLSNLPSTKLSNSVKNLANNSNQSITPVVEIVSSIIKKFYSGNDANIQSLNEKEGEADLKINKGIKPVTDVSYVEGVKNLLKTISDEMGINIFKIFDKIKIQQGEVINKGKANEYQGRVGTKGEGDNLKQSLTLAIPDAAILGNDAEARAKVIALIMEEAFIHGLSNKIPALFAEGADLAQARGELQSAYGAISNQKSEDLAGAFDSGKYLSSFEELLAAVLKGIAGHDVSGLKDQNLPEGDFKYAIIDAIKKSLSGPMLAAAIVPMLMASIAGAGTLEDERAAGFVNKNNGVEGSAIGDPRARENFFQKGIEDRRKDKGPNAAELSIYADRERKAEEAAKPSSAVEDIKKIRAEREKEAARVAAIKKQKEDARLAEIAGPPPTAEETAALEEKNQKEKEEKDKKEQAWLAAGGLYGQGGTLPVEPKPEDPQKNLDNIVKNVVDTIVAIPAAIEQSSKNNPPLLRSTNPNAPKGGIKGSTNVPPDSIISGSQAPFYSTAPTAKPTPAPSLPTIPVNSRPALTNKKPASIKEEKYVTFPLNIKDPLTSNLIKDADTYDTGKGKLRLNKGDAPEVSHGTGELDQPGGREAENAARNILANAKKIEAKVLVDSEGKPRLDAYQRLLGDILVDGESLTEKLAGEGHLHVSNIAGNEKPLSNMKEAARLKKGIWSKKFVEPSKWRKFSRAQKEAHIKDVEGSGDIQTPNNTLNQPPSPAPTPSPMGDETSDKVFDTPEVKAAQEALNKATQEWEKAQEDKRDRTGYTAANKKIEELVDNFYKLPEAIKLQTKIENFEQEYYKANPGSEETGATAEEVAKSKGGLQYQKDVQAYEDFKAAYTAQHITPLRDAADKKWNADKGPEADDMLKKNKAFHAAKLNLRIAKANAITASQSQEPSGYVERPPYVPPVKTPEAVTPEVKTPELVKVEPTKDKLPTLSSTDIPTSPMDSEIATPEVSETPKEKPSSNFGRLIALALGTAGVAGATLFRVLNKKKKEQEANTPKDAGKPKTKVSTAPPLSEDEIKEIDKAIAKLELEPETSEPVVPPEKPISSSTSDESDEYSNFTEMIKHWGFQTLKDVLGEMKPSEEGYTLEEQEKRNTINSEIERRKNFKPGIPGTISKNINSDTVYIGENGTSYLYDEFHNEIDTRHARSGDVDPNIADTPKIKPTDRNPLKPKNKNLKADLVNARIAFEKEKKLKDRAFLLRENQPPAEILAFENAEEELKNAQAAYDKSIENAAPVSTPSVEPTATTPDNTTPAPTREPARPSNKAAKFVPRRMGDGDLYGSAASQIQVPMELMQTPKVNAQLEKNHGAFNGMSAVEGLVGRSGGLNSHMILAALMGHSLSGDQAFKDKTSNFDPATVAYLLQKEVDNFTGADRGDLDKEVKPLNPTTIKGIDESGRGSLEQEQKKIEAYLKTMANPIFQKIARSNLVIVQNQLNRLNDIKRSTAETTAEVKKDEDEPLVISEPSDAATEDAKDTKPEITKNPDVTKEEKQEEKKEEAATKINAEAKQAIPRWREEVPAGWAEVLAETLNRYSGDAYADHDTIDVDSIVNAIPNTEEGKETKEKNPKFRYDYEAMDTTGTEVKDSINASSEEEAQQKVKELGYALTKITKSKKQPLPEKDEVEDNTTEKEYSYTTTDPNHDGGYRYNPERYVYANNIEDAYQQAQKAHPGLEIDDLENTADDKPSRVLPQTDAGIGFLGATFGAAVGVSFGTAAVGPIGGIIGSLIGGFLGKLAGGLLVDDFNNNRANNFKEREEEKKYRQEERNKKQKEDATDTPEIKEKRNEIEIKEAQAYDLENMKSPEDLEKELQAKKMSGANISDADIDVAVEKQKEAIEASADAIEKLKQELQALTGILEELIKNKPAVDPEAGSGRKPEYHKLGGFIGGKNSFPGEPKWPDETPVWAQDGEYITAKKDVPYMMAALGAYRKRGVSHMARGGVVGGGSATITRPSGGSYSSGDIMGPFKDKLNDFVKNTRFGAFVSNLTEASAKIQNFSQSMSGMAANASPDTFATFTGSIKLLSGAVGMALIPVFLRASQIIQTWAREIMNGTGTAGRLFSMFSSLVNSVLDGKFLALGVGIALLGAAVLPAIAFFGSLVSGVSLLINGFAFFRAALLASSLMLRRGAAVPPVSPVAAGAATATAGAGAATAGAVTAGTAKAGAGAVGSTTAKAGGTFAKLLAGGGGAAMTGGILSGIVGGVSEGMENADIKSMSTGENVVRTGAQVAGAGGGALAGAMSGAWAGAALGSLVGPLGTAVGGAVGGLIGGAMGSWGGSKIASGASNLAFGDKRRNEKDANGKPLPANDAKQQLSMAYQSSKSQSSYSSVEEAYKKIQVSALGDDPMTAELKKMNEHGLINMLKELEKVNEGVRENKIPMGASS